MNLFTINAFIRFLIEILTVTLVITIGLTKYSIPLNILIGIILPIIFILLWATFIAPNSPRRGSIFLQIFIELMVFSTCTYLLMFKISIMAGSVYLSVTFLNTIIIHLGNTLS